MKAIFIACSCLAAILIGCEKRSSAAPPVVGNPTQSAYDIKLSEVAALKFLTNGVSRDRVIKEFGDPSWSRSAGATNWATFSLARPMEGLPPEISGIMVGFVDNKAFSIRPVVMSVVPGVAPSADSTPRPNPAKFTIRGTGKEILAVQPEAIVLDRVDAQSPPSLAFSVTLIIPQKDIVKIESYTRNHLHEDLQFLFGDVVVTTGRVHEAISTNRINLRFPNGVKIGALYRQ